MKIPQNRHLRIESFIKFLTQNQDEINAKIKIVNSKNKGLSKIKRAISADNDDKKSFWRMIGRFLIANIASIIIFSFYLGGLFLLLTPLILVSKKSESSFSQIIAGLTIIILGIAQIYFWTIWAAYLASNVIFYTDSTLVNHKWIYYVVGFMAVSGPLGWLSNKESQTADSYEDVARIKSGTNYYSIISFAAYLAYCIWPKLLLLKPISIVVDIFH